MAINMIRNYPMPRKFNSFDEIHDYLVRLIQALSEGDSEISMRLQRELDEIYEPKS